MFNVLLESKRQPALPSASVILSASLHVVLAALLLSGTGVAPDLSVPESFITRALFLPPVDRVASLAPSGERLQYLSLGVAPGGLAEFTDLPIGQSVTGTSRALDVTGGVNEGDDELSSPYAPLVIGNDTAFSIYQVDEAVARHIDSEGPAYPTDLLAKQIEGSVYMRYVVDTTGRADTATAQVIRSSHPLFTQAVLAVLPRMRFRPATMGDRLVRQLVEQEFAFRIQQPGAGQVGPPVPPR